MGVSRGPIRYVFLHFDGVILENILAPIIFNVIQELGGVYSAEIENNIFAKSQKHAANFIIKHLNLTISTEEVINLYYTERKHYEATHEIKLNQGVESFLILLKSFGYEVISYGGAPIEYFLGNVGSLSSYFSEEKYIQTKDFRPGVQEILSRFQSVKPSEALFIDEEFTIAQACHSLQVPFVGFSTKFEYSFQRKEMQKFGVKYIINSLEEIDRFFLEKIQEDVLGDCIWSNCETRKE